MLIAYDVVEKQLIQIPLSNDLLKIYQKEAEPLQLFLKDGKLSMYAEPDSDKELLKNMFLKSLREIILLIEK